MSLKITYRADPKDPPFLLMHGDTPLSREFNKREEAIIKTGQYIDYSPDGAFKHAQTIIMEILADDYNRRHGERKKKSISGVTIET